MASAHKAKVKPFPDVQGSTLRIIPFHIVSSMYSGEFLHPPHVIIAFNLQHTHFLARYQ